MLFQQAVDITSANLVCILNIPGVIPAGIQIQGYMPDDMIDSEIVRPTEAIVGADGLMAAGVIPFLTKVTFNLLPGTLSYAAFESWQQAQNGPSGGSGVIFANAELQFPSISRAYSLVNGVLTGMRIFPSAKKILSGTPFETTWGTISGANI